MYRCRKYEGLESYVQNDEIKGIVSRTPRLQMEVHFECVPHFLSHVVAYGFYELGCEEWAFQVIHQLLRVDQVYRNTICIVDYIECKSGHQSLKKVVNGNNE
jgi:hypothetical protein